MYTLWQLDNIMAIGLLIVAGFYLAICVVRAILMKAGEFISIAFTTLRKRIQRNKNA